LLHHLGLIPEWHKQVLPLPRLDGGGKVDVSDFLWFLGRSYSLPQLHDKERHAQLATRVLEVVALGIATAYKHIRNSDVEVVIFHDASITFRCGSEAGFGSVVHRGLGWGSVGSP
jgi:hypothetical protein